LRIRDEIGDPQNRETVCRQLIVMVLDSAENEKILDLIVCIQGRRMEDQRASLVLPELSVEAPMASTETKKKQK
jgi:hypothetical protein